MELRYKKRDEKKHEVGTENGFGSRAGQIFKRFKAKLAPMATAAAVVFSLQACSHARSDGCFWSNTVADNDAAKTYNEQHEVEPAANVACSNYQGAVFGALPLLSYKITFSGSADDFGIPSCTTPEGQDYNACLDVGGNLDYATVTHKVRVKFLGEDLVISNMTPPTVVIGTSETKVYTGGYVKLAKEAFSGLINPGESLEIDNLKFRLDDLEAHGDTTSAILSVLDANDNILKKDKVAPGQTKEFNILGKIYRVHVYKVALGYAFGAKWADMAIYAKELKLENEQHPDPDYEPYTEYKVTVGWKDKGADGVHSPDHLRTIGIYKLK